MRRGFFAGVSVRVCGFLNLKLGSWAHLYYPQLEMGDSQRTHVTMRLAWLYAFRAELSVGYFDGRYPHQHLHGEKLRDVCSRQ